MKHFKLITITTIATLSIVAVIIIVSSKPSSGSDTTITVAPSKASMVLDSTAQVKNGKNSLTPGKHKIIAKYPGFKDYETSFTVIAGKQNSVLIALVPSSTEGSKYYQNNQNEFAEIEALSGEKFADSSKSATKNFPLIQELPLNVSPQYRIDYGVSKKYPDDPAKIAIYISSASLRDKSDAIQMIYDIGYDPSDYEIIFQPLR